MQEKPSEKKEMNPWQAVGFVWDVFASIAVPTTFLALAGRWLDERYGTSPWFVLVGLVLALGISYVLVMRKARTYRP